MHILFKMLMYFMVILFFGRFALAQVNETTTIESTTSSTSTVTSSVSTSIVSVLTKRSNPDVQFLAYTPSSTSTLESTSTSISSSTSHVPTTSSTTEPTTTESTSTSESTTSESTSTSRSSTVSSSTVSTSTASTTSTSEYSTSTVSSSSSSSTTESTSSSSTITSTSGQETSTSTLASTSTDQPIPAPIDGPNIGAIVGGVVGGLALIAILIGLSIIIYRSRRRRPLANAHVMAPMAISHNGRSRPIDLYKFYEILPELMHNSAFSLMEEFAALCELSPVVKGEKHVTGLKEENLPKNRYADILPFDSTRVLLDGDRYINASYIRGFNRQREYIAAQGPMGDEDRRTRGKHSTIDDFFEMIWQYNVTRVIMLTQLLEAGRPKCARYWPIQMGDSVQHGIFTVTLLNEIDCGMFWTRELELRRIGQVRTLIQYHYKRWPDMTATDEEELLAFVRLIRQSVQNSINPILVHCSAGVGRTGVFIALDILLQNIRQRSYIDIAACVYSLRQQRVRMVQVEVNLLSSEIKSKNHCVDLQEQYIMLYSAMGIAIQQLLQSRQAQVMNGNGISRAV